MGVGVFWAGVRGGGVLRAGGDAMRITLENDWPVNSTRFLLPAVALRGFRAGPRTVTLAWWTWRIVIRLPDARLDRQDESRP